MVTEGRIAEETSAEATSRSARRAIPSPANMITSDPNNLNELRESANEAGKLVRAAYLTVLAVGTYLAIAIGSTTDLMLIKGADIKLPLIDVGLPIRGFYLIAPFLFVLLHLNLLVQIKILSGKLWDLDRCIRAQRWTRVQERLERRKVYSFLFSHYLIGDEDGIFTRFMLAAINTMSLIVLPVIILMWALIRFLPYHDDIVTWANRIAVIVDLTVVAIIWSSAMRRHLTFRIWLDRTVSTPLRILRWWQRSRHKWPIRKRAVFD